MLIQALRWALVDIVIGNIWHLNQRHDAASNFCPQFFEGCEFALLALENGDVGNVSGHYLSACGSNSNFRLVYRDAPVRSGKSERWLMFIRSSVLRHVSLSASGISIFSRIVA